MELIETRAMRVQDQGPARPRHHLRQQHLAHGAAARGEMNMHDGRVDGLQRAPQYPHGARVNGGAGKPLAFVHGGHVPDRGVGR
jgi:hypothetical protein